MLRHARGMEGVLVELLLCTPTIVTMNACSPKGWRSVITLSLGISGAQIKCKAAGNEQSNPVVVGSGFEHELVYFQALLRT